MIVKMLVGKMVVSDNKFVFINCDKYNVLMSYEENVH